MHNSQKCTFPLHYWLKRLEVLFYCSTFPFLGDNENIENKCHGNLEQGKNIKYLWSNENHINILVQIQKADCLLTEVN